MLCLKYHDYCCLVFKDVLLVFGVPLGLGYVGESVVLGGSVQLLVFTGWVLYFPLGGIVLAS